MPRRPLRPAALLVAAVAAAVLGACSDGGAEPAATPSSTSTSVVADLPPVVEEFLAGAAGDDARFTADYRVLRKLGSLTADVRVEQDPPWTRIEAGDVVVVDGPEPATCRLSAGRCVGEVREQPLAGLGFFSGFATTGPREAIQTLARRADAVFSTGARTLAGVELECLAASVGGTPAAEWCLTPEGAFGYTDTAVQRVELVGYRPEADVDGELPGELVPDDAFLAAP